MASTADSMTPNGNELTDDIDRVSIAIGVVRGLADVVASAGVHRETFLRATELGPDRLDAPDQRMHLLEYNRIVELALDMAGDEALGLRWAASLTERTFVPISHLIAHCATLREALELLGRYVHLMSNWQGYTVLSRGACVVLRHRPFEGAPLRLERFSAELLLGGFWRFLESFGAGAKDGTASFAYPAPTHRAEYARFFGHRVRFEQAYTELQFDMQLLDAPSPQRDDEVRDAMRDVVEQRLIRIAHGTPWAARVHEVLVRESHSQRIRMETTARALGVSVRTLRRRLAAEGKTYDGVLGEARCARAKRLLRDPERPIREVAYALGFSDPSTFHRAFKRWAGTTPMEYRASQLDRGR